MTRTTTTFKDFVITELSPRSVRGRASSGEFMVCRPVRDELGNLSVALDLPDSVKRQMLSAIKSGQFIRIFNPLGH